jgi:glycosyltransferase involved in cell wall biosynthesis
VAVVLACPGLDRTRRGFETFARECFEALRADPSLALLLAKGSGARRPGEAVLQVPRREGRLVRSLSRLVSREPYIVEHVAFAVRLVPWLVRQRPDVVYFSEWHVGRVLSALRWLSGSSYALVFCNGGLVSHGYAAVDLVQQLVPGAIEYAVDLGESVVGQTLLPLGVRTPIAPPPGADAQGALRRRLGLPEQRRIVLSSGAINRQKRMDYLIEEIASMPEPRPFLLLLGEEEGDSPAIRRLASERLGHDGHAIRSVAPDAMGAHYEAADAFVLASLWESFGRVLVEAQSHGLPCLAHDHPVMRWVLGAEGSCLDLRDRGRVKGWLEALSATDFSDDVRERRWRSASERFSWDALAPRYVEMLRGAAEARRGS